jgi:hypothetical protein
MPKCWVLAQDFGRSSECLMQERIQPGGWVCTSIVVGI